MRPFLFTCCILMTACSIHSLDVPMNGGTAHLTAIRPLGSSSHMHVDYNPDTKTLTADYGQQIDRIDYKALGEVIGAAIAAAVKAAVVTK